MTLLFEVKAFLGLRCMVVEVLLKKSYYFARQGWYYDSLWRNELAAEVKNCCCYFVAVHCWLLFQTLEMKNQPSIFYGMNWQSGL